MAAPLPLLDHLFDPKSELSALEWEQKVAQVWRYQMAHNTVMQRFCALLEVEAPTFMPIRFFKDFEMRCGADWVPQAVFKSSGTTGQESSRHWVRDLAIYDASLFAGFEHFYAKREYAIFALLPNYLERGDSSLVYMVKRWIEQFGLPGSGFYLYNFDALRQALCEAMGRGERILLIGVSFALLDFAEAHAIHLPSDAIVMETGGMKGRREELTRSALHQQLGEAFGVKSIHSEYGMTELLSQAYALENGRFRCPPWMRVVITDVYVPQKRAALGEVGRLNVIDLANIHSCAFIATDDLGRLYPDGSFEVLGRLDNSELRGCNLMYVG